MITLFKPETLVILFILTIQAAQEITGTILIIETEHY